MQDREQLSEITEEETGRKGFRKDKCENCCRINSDTTLHTDRQKKQCNTA